MFRNLGGSIGIALLATQLDVREKFHSARLGESASLFNPATQERLDALVRHFTAQGAGAGAARQQALAALSNTVRREAGVMASADCFFILAVLLLAMAGAVWCCKPVKGAAIGAE
jgi:DHA2 family multidrug resistance protein